MLNFSHFITEEQKSTLKYHDTLNPVFWDEDKFDKIAKNRLLEIAEYWREYALIPKKAVKDILIVGGNANYNYTEFSDVDLHLLVDKNQIEECQGDVLDEYLKDKKTLWTLTHDIKIYGYSLEIYAQGIDEKFAKNQGVYSILKDKWIQEPKKQEVNLKDPLIKKKFNIIKNHIKYMIDNKVNSIEALKNYSEKIRRMRSAAVRKAGEFSIENLVFKELRNQGWIDKFSDYIKSTETKTFSLKRGEK